MLYSWVVLKFNLTFMPEICPITIPCLVEFYNIIPELDLILVQLYQTFFQYLEQSIHFLHHIVCVYH